MTPHVLNGAFERVRRAEEHLTDLINRTAGWRREQEDTVIYDFDPHPPHEFRPDMSRTIGPPFIIGILIGEIAYNLRSALDYLIFELATHDSGSPKEMTQFPIVNSAHDFNHRIPTWLNGVNAAHVTMIERLQPYNGCNWTKRLRDISNPDKHRHLIGIFVPTEIKMYTVANDPYFPDANRPIRRANHPVHGEMDMQIAVIATIRFADQTAVSQTLNEIKTQVANTLVDFKPEF